MAFLPVFTLPAGHAARLMRLSLAPTTGPRGGKQWAFYGRSDQGYAVPARFAFEGAYASFAGQPWPSFVTRGEAYGWLHQAARGKPPGYQTWDGRSQRYKGELDAYSCEAKPRV